MYECMFKSPVSVVIAKDGTDFYYISRDGDWRSWVSARLIRQINTLLPSYNHCDQVGCKQGVVLNLSTIQGLTCASPCQALYSGPIQMPSLV